MEAGSRVEAGGELMEQGAHSRKTQNPNHRSNSLSDVGSRKTRMSAARERSVGAMGEKDTGGGPCMILAFSENKEVG